jgi:hypothetical protein
MVRNALKYEFWIQWSGSGAFVMKTPTLVHLANSNVVEFEKLSNFHFGHFFIWVLDQREILFYK